MYNEAAHLSECIESVLRQTYSHWEYTILDNCSTDDSLRIARQYAEKDPRIRVAKNGHFLTAIRNHNAALREISPASKYCKMVFADDWIFPECLERMVEVAQAHPSVGIVGAYGLDGRQVLWVGLPYPGSVSSGREICRSLFCQGPYVFGSATSLLFRADLVRSRPVFYREDNIHSDTETCIELLKGSDFGFVHQILTFSRVREHSLVEMSRGINTFDASKLVHLVTHGPDFLTEEEIRDSLRRTLRSYYRYMAGSVLRNRSRSFWDYHKKVLQQAGLTIGRVRLAWAVMARLCEAVLNPRETIRSLQNTISDESQVFEREMGCSELGMSRGAAKGSLAPLQDRQPVGSSAVVVDR